MEFAISLAALSGLYVATQESQPQNAETIENFEGTKNVTINEGGSMGDVQAGIEFIYHMREHIVDVGVATVYLFVCYGIYLTMKKYIK